MIATTVALPENSDVRSSCISSDVESQIRDLVRGNHGGTPPGPSTSCSSSLSEPGAAHITDLIEGCAAASVHELDKLLTEMTAARDALRAEADRIKSELATYMTASTTVTASVKTISINLDQWRKTAAA